MSTTHVKIILTILGVLLGVTISKCGKLKSERDEARSALAYAFALSNLVESFNAPPQPNSKGEDWVGYLRKSRAAADMIAAAAHFLHPGTTNITITNGITLLNANGRLSFFPGRN